MPENTDRPDPEPERAPDTAAESELNGQVGNNASEVHTTAAHPDTETTAAETTGLETTGLETTGLETTDTEAAGTAHDHPTDVTTTYERSAEGHRVTRRTVHRSEVTEDTRETIKETYPVSIATPYAPSVPGHPSPVG